MQKAHQWKNGDGTSGQLQDKKLKTTTKRNLDLNLIPLHKNELKNGS